MKNQTYIFIGRSGSGKGTQLDLLKKSLLSKDNQIEINSVVMGEIFREFFKEPGLIQDIAREVSIQKGKFQPNFLTDALFINKIINTLKNNQILFLDGYPRNLHQLSVIKELLLYIEKKNAIVIDIEVSRESVRQRMLSRGRGDDNVSAIENRLNEYDKYIIPMIEKIKEDSFFKYFKIDGEGKIEDIHVDIINNIDKYLKLNAK